MADQVSSLLGKAGASNSRGNGSNRIQTYESMDVLSLLIGAETLVGKKVLLAGRLLDLESGSGTSYLDVDGSMGEESPRCELFRVIYEGDVEGLGKGCELRIWGTCVGTYSRPTDNPQSVRSFPLVKADILQWRKITTPGISSAAL